MSAAKGKKATEMIAKPLEEKLSEVWKVSREMRQHSPGIVREAARGAVHAVDDVTMDIGRLSHDIVLAITGSLDKSHHKPRDIINEASYGVVRGAGETSTDVGEAALQAVEAAKQAASQSGLSPDEAAIHAARGAIEAAETLGPEAENRVRQVLVDELMEGSYSDSKNENYTNEEPGEEK